MIFDPNLLTIPQAQWVVPEPAGSYDYVTRPGIQQSLDVSDSSDAPAKLDWNSDARENSFCRLQVFGVLYAECSVKIYDVQSRGAVSSISAAISAGSPLIHLGTGLSRPVSDERNRPSFKSIGWIISIGQPEKLSMKGTKSTKRKIFFTSCSFVAFVDNFFLHNSAKFATTEVHFPGSFSGWNWTPKTFLVYTNRRISQTVIGHPRRPESFAAST